MDNLIEQTHQIKIYGRNISYYKKIGYNCVYGEIITVTSSNLNPSTSERVKCVCSECGKIVDVPFKQYMNCKKGFVCSSKCKMRKTNRNLKDEFGVTNFSQLKEIKEKKKQSAIKKYGVDNISQSKEIKEQKKQSSLRVYGVDNISQSEIIKKQKITTCKLHYGVEYALQSTKIKNKIIKKLQLKYGDNITNISQVAEIMDKKFLTGICAKKYTLPSGRIVSYQGYEHYGLQYLLANGYVEDDIVIGNKEIENIIGKIMFYDLKVNKNRRYFPDIYIKSENKIYEVKSTYTIKLNVDLIKMKEDAEHY